MPAKKGSNTRGRPSSYLPEYSEQSYKLCLLGATDKELADFFDVSTVTLNAWKKQFPEFLNSLKGGKLDADARVAQSLFHRAIGYSHKEEKIFNNNGTIVRAETIKHYPPDPTSMIFWLKNRQVARWRDKPEGGEGGDDLATMLVKLAEKLPGA